MKKVLAVVSFVVSGLLLCFGVVLFAFLAFLLLLNVYATMSPDSDGTVPTMWGQLAWVLGLSFLGFFSSWLSLVAGMLLWLSAKKSAERRR